MTPATEPMTSMTEETFLIHPFGPLYAQDARVLILGSFPSVKSRDQKFFYGHPQNRFWKIAAALADPSVMEAGLSGAPIEPPKTIEEKKALILRSRIALWDTIGSCTITGSSDSSIRNVQVNDLSVIFCACGIRRVYCNGTASYDLYMKYMPAEYPRPVKLPSTSPANAAWTLPKLLAAWKCVADDLK